MTALLSIEVWRGSPSSAFVEVFQGTRRIDRIEVIPGDCLDLELEAGGYARLQRAEGDECGS